MTRSTPGRQIGLLLFVLLAAGCRVNLSSTTPSPADPIATPPAAQTPDVPTPPTPTPIADPQPSQPPAGAVSIQQVWENRAAWVNKSLTIADVVSLETRCPDVEGAGSNQCTTMVWLGATGRHPFPVYQGGKWVSCQGMVSPATGCNSWRNGETYQVIATLRQKQLSSGTLLDSYYLEVTVISQR